MKVDDRQTSRGNDVCQHDNEREKKEREVMIFPSLQSRYGMQLPEANPVKMRNDTKVMNERETTTGPAGETREQGEAEKAFEDSGDGKKGETNEGEEKGEVDETSMLMTSSRTSERLKWRHRQNLEERTSAAFL